MNQLATFARNWTVDYVQRPCQPSMWSQAEADRIRLETAFVKFMFQAMTGYQLVIFE